ncbi:hypothetical protein, partial [Streptomyces sp. SID3343]|uniref:hypothetical protein n=1 Tax=Streptomyces sp. SID3343 TaxID=2690260 RepID=UPI001370271F
MHTDLVGVDQEQYDALTARVESGEVRADGCVAHVAVAIEGGVQVVDLWESQAAMDAFTARMTPRRNTSGQGRARRVRPGT